MMKYNFDQHTIFIVNPNFADKCGDKYETWNLS
jgi:hypothetical protein